MSRIFASAARVAMALLAVGVVGLTSGCATITGTETQNISLQVMDTSGAAVADSECKLTNDKGNWRVKPPAITVVVRSAEDLLVQCDADGQPTGTLRAISRANAGMVGNIIFGGVVGAVIDHSKGTAYDYPSLLRVVFGTSQVVDAANAPGGSPANPPAPPPAASAADSSMPAEGGPRATGQAVSLDDLKALLPQ